MTGIEMIMKGKNRLKEAFVYMPEKELALKIEAKKAYKIREKKSIMKLNDWTKISQILKEKRILHEKI